MLIRSGKLGKKKLVRSDKFLYVVVVKSTQDVVRLFPMALKTLVSKIQTVSPSTTKDTIAAQLGIKAPRLSALMHGPVIAGSKTVACICEKLDRHEAGILMEAYFRDEIATVSRLAAKNAWGTDTLVEVKRVPFG